ncbi:hypothetical protein AB0K18_22445 [Nonomuraea sp. NPDC049421]|uniref:hypothetical protein n=1 Tax=Nonomuraea sp. NPDC049421 TaxID=3155275 RepID=UPI00343895BA
MPFTGLLGVSLLAAYIIVLIGIRREDKELNLRSRPDEASAALDAKGTEALGAAPRLQTVGAPSDGWTHVDRVPSEQLYKIEKATTRSWEVTFEVQWSLGDSNS